MIQIALMLLLAGLLSTAVMAEPSVSPITASVAFKDAWWLPYLVVHNTAKDSVKVQEMPCVVKQLNGASAPEIRKQDAFGIYTLQAGESREMMFLPQTWFELQPEQAYLVTCSWKTLGGQGENNRIVSLTFPYLAPAQQFRPVFPSDWADVPLRPGLQCRLFITLQPATNDSSVTVEYRNQGKVALAVYDISWIRTSVLQGEKQIMPVALVEATPPELKSIPLPPGAWISLPARSFTAGAPSERNRIRVWLGEEQYALDAGSTYTVKAIVTLPGDDWAGPRETTLPAFTVVVPKIVQKG